jgi:NAD(P)-dependent dehydrogenase (short-subunit alcohol dehydrogenase family)
MSGPGGPNARRPLTGRTILVVGAEDEPTRRTALQLAARGAALVIAGRDHAKVLVAAGYAASSGGMTRVIEEASPPLLGDALLERATAALRRPTDVVVAEAVFAVAADAANAAEELRSLLGATARTIVVPTKPPGGSRAFAEGVSAQFERGLAKS